MKHNSNICLLLNRTVGSESCEAKMTGIAKSFKLYSIGEMQAVGGENPMAWFRIYPRKEDNTGWWYYQGAKNTNSKLLIHPKEKNSKSNEGFLVSDNICWAKLHEMIRTSKSFVTILRNSFEFIGMRSKCRNYCNCTNY